MRLQFQVTCKACGVLNNVSAFCWFADLDVYFTAAHQTPAARTPTPTVVGSIVPLQQHTTPDRRVASNHPAAQRSCGASVATGAVGAVSGN